MIKWKKPNNQIIETNEREATIKKALELRWERIKPVVKSRKNKRN